MITDLKCAPPNTTLVVKSEEKKCFQFLFTVIGKYVVVIRF